jgi:hypothetical protein
MEFPAFSPPAAGSAVQDQKPAGAAPASPGRGLRVAGIVCGAVGLASIGTGVYFYARAKAYSDRVSSARTWNSSDYQAGKDAETMQWVFYGIGAGATITGAVLYLVGRLASVGPVNVSVAPILVPGAAGIGAQGVF